MNVLKAGLLAATLAVLGARSFPSASYAHAHAPSSRSHLEVRIDRQDGIVDSRDLDDPYVQRAGNAMSGLLLVDPVAAKEEIVKALEDEFSAVTGIYGDPWYYLEWDEEVQDWVRVCVGAETYIVDDAKDDNPVRVVVQRVMIVG